MDTKCGIFVFYILHWCNNNNKTSLQKNNNDDDNKNNLNIWQDGFCSKYFKFCMKIA